MAKTVLIVDNEPFVLNLVGKIIASGGYQSLVANDWPQCQEILSQNKPDLILMDLMMPEMNGWDMIKAIKSDRKFQDVKIAALTAKEKDEEHEGLDDIIDYITKPFERQELLDRINEIIGEP